MNFKKFQLVLKIRIKDKYTSVTVNPTLPPSSLSSPSTIASKIFSRLVNSK